MYTRQTDRNQIETRLRQMEVSIKTLQAKLEDADAEARGQYTKQIEALVTERQAALDKLKELRKAESGTWDRFKTSLRTAWTSSLSERSS